MDFEQTKNFIGSFIAQYSKTIALDLAGCTADLAQTTKRSRRERCLAYLLESVTGAVGSGGCAPGDFKYPSEQWVIDLLNLTEAAQAHVKDSEAVVGLKRAAKRLHRTLAEPVEYIKGYNRCLACGEIYRGTDHVCTNAVARGKDSRLARDPDLL